MLILKIEPSKFLHALAGIHLGSEDISLSVYGDVVPRRKLANLAARLAEATERFLRGVIDDAHLAIHPIGHVDELLFLIRREYEVVDRSSSSSGLLVDVLRYETPVFMEDLQAIVGAVANVNQTFLIDTDTIYPVVVSEKTRLSFKGGSSIKRKSPIGCDRLFSSACLYGTRSSLPGACGLSRMEVRRSRGKQNCR